MLAHLTDLKTAEFFLNNISRISGVNFVPSDDDIKFYHENFNQDCRGVEEMAFEFSEHKYRYGVFFKNIFIDYKYHTFIP